jgi:N-acylglucosamine 2-epimerase
MNKKQRDHYLQLYRDGLLTNILPFWIKSAVDSKDGGYLFCLDRDGSILSTDKPMWIHGRFVWLLATLYDTVEKRKEWLDLAQHGMDFIDKYGFDQDGRMFFMVTKEGKPLRKRRYLFTESFAVIAMAALAKAGGDAKLAKRALDLFKLIIHYHTTPSLLPPKIIPETRQSKALAMPMILIATAQVLRTAVSDSVCKEWIDRSIKEIKTDFMKEEFSAVIESTGPKGEFMDTFEGRMICPGHAIEAGWFILHEAKWRNNDTALSDIGLKILDWSWKWGWDEKNGGILYYRDAKGHPPAEYWHDMKFWWPQNEAIIATLLAYDLTKDEKYLQWHQMAHDWAYKHLPDPEYGEWFGYLHRDGTISSTLKGNYWKGPFHLPRMQLYCWKLLEEMKL